MNLLRPRTHRKPVRSELDGGPAGVHVEHWDDHQDAVAQPKPIEMKLAVNEEE